MRSSEFKDELEQVVGHLRQGVLKSLEDMRHWCEDHGGALKGGRVQYYGYTVETERYLYCLRCSPEDQVYQAYLTCFDKQAQKQTLEAEPLVGRATFASGERWNFTDPQKYLQMVREELPYQATTGFRCETLTDDPAIRKAVDDMLCDLYGEENPRQSEDYGGTGMMMGGMSG